MRIISVGGVPPPTELITPHSSGDTNSPLWADRS